MSGDAPVARWVHAHLGGTGAVRAAEVASGFGTLLAVVLLTAAVLLVGLRLGHATTARAAVLGVVLAKLLGPALKQLVHRSRPHLWEPAVHAGGFSMPSGHAGGAAAVATAAWLVARGTRWSVPVAVAGVVLAGLVGASRVVLGVHWPSDVVAGWALGVACPLLTVRLARFAQARSAQVEP